MRTVRSACVAGPPKPPLQREWLWHATWPWLRRHRWMQNGWLITEAQWQSYDDRTKNTVEDHFTKLGPAPKTYRGKLHGPARTA